MGPSTGLFDVGGQRLATPPIRGRAGELKVIGALVSAVAQGRGGVLVIEGPPGIGKSRLLTEVLALADKCGVRTLFGEAFEYQQTVPFSRCSWRPCAPIPLSATPRRCAGWAARRICAIGWCTIWPTRFMQRPHTPRWRFCWRTFTGPITARCWRCGRWPRAPDVAVLWVLTARTGAGGPAMQETLSVLQRANATFCGWRPSRRSAVADMVQDAVRAKADVSLLNLAAKAHGNPFLVSELVGGWARRTG